MSKKDDYKGMDIDKPVDYCPVCGCGMWISMITGTLLYSCNCISNKKYFGLKERKK
jgi:hypothetical protein